MSIERNAPLEGKNREITENTLFKGLNNSTPSTPDLDFCLDIYAHPRIAGILKTLGRLRISAVLQISGNLEREEIAIKHDSQRYN